MHCSQRLITAILAVYLGCFLLPKTASSFPSESGPPLNDKTRSIFARISARLEAELARQAFRPGSPLFIRIFKMPGELEIWLLKNGGYSLFKTYSICDFSGFLGPKLAEGDWQSPEGFYSVDVEQMNPDSSYHLSFNIGYPNEFDRQQDRRGTNIMIHGSCSSTGCFAMGNGRMEEIYFLAHAALAGGQQSFPVHIFPFRMTRKNMDKYRDSPWYSFWQQLQPGYLLFEQWKTIPQISVADGKYVVHQPMEVASRRVAP